MTNVQRTLRTRFGLKSTFALAAVLGLGAALTACGPSNTGTASTTPAPSQSATTAPSTPGPTPSTVQSPMPSITPATALCTAADLKGSLDDSGGGAAGHIYMKLIVTKVSAGNCILDGYPGVSLVKAGSIDPIGAPAVRDAQAPSQGPITLTPGQSAAATLRYTQAGNYQDCQQTPADAVLVYPPSATDNLAIPRPLTACSNDNILLLSIGAFAP